MMTWKEVTIYSIAFALIALLLIRCVGCVQEYNAGQAEVWKAYYESGNQLPPGTAQ